MTDIEEWAGFVTRILRATERRVSNGDIEGLTVMAALRHELDGAMRTAVVRLRSEPWNYSWADVGRALGITRQSAQERFGGRSIVGTEMGGEPDARRDD
jgi:hypothetical protein